MSHIDFIRKNEKNNIELKNEESVPYLSFPRMEDTNQVIHGFSTRLGGVSQNHLSSMNLSFTRGDEEENVFENYKRITKALGVSYESLVLSKQTHTTNVKVVTKDDKGKGIIRKRDYTDIDGFVTNERGVTLVTFYADCVPLFFLDPINYAIGASHSGWRGTLNQIGKKTIEVMKQQYGTNPKDVIAIIGPSICVDCYEVSEEVIEEFQAGFTSDIVEKISYPKENGKFQLDLWEANRQVLIQAGLREENIEITNICTCCNPSLLFSHRASKGLRGNLAGFIALKN